MSCRKQAFGNFVAGSEDEMPRRDARLSRSLHRGSQKIEGGRPRIDHETAMHKQIGSSRNPKSGPDLRWL
jgi:hypothetical protein